MKDLFIGSAVSRIGLGGLLPLGNAFCTTIQSRGAKLELFVGADPAAGCLVVHDRAGLSDRHHRREAQAMHGIHSAADRHVARRQSFGCVTATRMDGRGRIAVAPWIWAHRGTTHRALLVGMGDHFEIWNLDQLLADGPTELSMLAQLHLHTPFFRSARHEPSVHLVDTHAGPRRAGEPGFPVQPLPALRSGPDLLGGGPH